MILPVSLKAILNSLSLASIKKLVKERREIRWRRRKQLLISDIINVDLSGRYLFFADIQQAMDWGNTNFGSWADKIKDEYSLSIHTPYFTKLKSFEYQAGWFYIQVNEALRFKKYQFPDIKDQIDQIIDLIDEELFASLILDSISVARIVTVSFFREYYLKNRRLKAGLIIKDDAYMSTSLHINFEGEFEWRSFHGGSEGLCYMYIKINKGKRGLYLNKISGRDNEQELLLPRNSSLKIDRVLHNKERNILLLLTLE